ncbi:MAG: aldehyde dehydrogenase family protein [Caldilineaceae bacterium]|nr:aldehyde dehydrogenase family protein [Caldilineaceae bacterium]
MSTNGSVPIYNLYINGQWRAPEGEQYRPAIDPSNGDLLAQIAQADICDTEIAIQAARTAFDAGDWANMQPGARSRLLHQLVDALEERQAEIADAEMRNSGCTWRKATLMDIPLGLVHFRHFAKLADFEPLEPVPQITMPALSYNVVRREPIGVCGQIIPWNFPFLMAVWKIAPALAAGNTIVIKPASYTPLSAVKMFEIIHDSGLLPPGVINLVTGPGQVVGPELCTNPMVDKIAFTGSTEVGREIMQQAASTIKKVTLELGGKSPNIILDDADLEIAVDGSIWASFMHNGQACESGSRLFVASEIYDEFVQRLVDRVAQLKVGLSEDGATDLGPVISAGQLRSIEKYIEIGINEGATPLLLGERPSDPELADGFYITPTIFAGVDNSMRIAQEEIFGPVLCIIKYDNVDDAIRMANDTIYGLAAGVWSRDVERALSVANRIRAGTVWINDFHLISAEAPFGGYKQSGLGRELGEWGLKEYLETKHIHIDLTHTRESKFWFDIVAPQLELTGLASHELRRLQDKEHPRRSRRNTKL